MSPFIFTVPLIQPSQPFSFDGGGGGITNAIGSPFFVTSILFPVFFTLSKTFKQVALDIAICIEYFFMVKIPSQIV